MCAGRAHLRSGVPNVTAAGDARYRRALCRLGSRLVNPGACDGSFHRLEVGHSAASHSQEDIPILENAPGV